MASQDIILERERASQMHYADERNAETSRDIRRSPSAVIRELTKILIDGEYSTMLAQPFPRERRRRSLVRKMNRLHMAEIVRTYLVSDWRPDQIAGRSRIEFAGDLHTNELLKQFLPKRTDFHRVSCQDLDHHPLLINDRPFRRLD